MQKDAKLRTASDKRQALPNWDSKWSDCFCDNPDPEMGRNYFALMDQFAEELGVGLKRNGL
jgi:isopentenyldiphosphate isomerase